MDDPWADTTPTKGAPPATDPVEDSPTSPEKQSSIETEEQVPVGEDEQDDGAAVALGSPSGTMSKSDGDRDESIPQNGVLPEQTTEGGADDDGFDDFDDFDEPAAGPSTIAGGSGAVADSAGDDGFGDFGDFEEGDLEADAPVEGTAPAPPASVAPAGPEWQSLRLRPLPPRSEIVAQLSELLEPMLASSSGSSSNLTDEPVRAVGGLRQVMVTPGSQDAYVQLNTPPQLKPLDWMRSRVRREHLISMGVPVNLDEVESHRLTALPPLRITTSSMPPPQVPHRRTPSRSLEEARVSADGKGKGRDSGVGVDGRNGSSEPSGLGERPELDTEKAEEMCGMEEDKLSLLPLVQLKRMQDELAATSAQASALLAWLLQLKDAQTQDSATYNGMISELIANAAKAKSAQTASSGGVFRRSSQRQRPQSVVGGGGGGGSNGATPRSATPSHLR